MVSINIGLLPLSIVGRGTAVIHLRFEASASDETEGKRRQATRVTPVGPEQSQAVVFNFQTLITAACSAEPRRHPFSGNLALGELGSPGNWPPDSPAP